MFGKVYEVPQNEKTPFYPRSPYGVAKLYGHWITVNYRDSFDLYACSGIAFNHESPRRGLEFVTRKITKGIADIIYGNLDCLELGNLGAHRDWGFAGDYVKAMHLILQQEFPGDYVIATGETHSIQEFCDSAFMVAGHPIVWVGEGLDKKAIDLKTGKVVVKINEKLHRPAEVDMLVGDSTKIRALGWEPEVGFEQLVEMMVEGDL